MREIKKPKEFKKRFIIKSFLLENIVIVIWCVFVGVGMFVLYTLFLWVISYILLMILGAIGLTL